MKFFIKFIIGILLTTTAHAESFEDFKEYVLEEIKTLKEENMKQDQEITALKRGREELISVIQNNVQDIQTNVQDIVYSKYFSTLMNVPQTCQELGSRGVDRSGSFPINPEGSGMYLIFFIITAMMFQINKPAQINE